MTRPANSPGDGSRDLADAMIAVQVHCCRCMYDLRGLVADGRCPECGLEIYHSLQQLVDPAATKLPKLRDPIGVGNAVVWLMFCCLMGALLLAGHTLVLAAAVVDTRQAFLMGFVTAHDVVLLAAVAAFCGLWAVYRLNPRTAEGRRDFAVRLHVALVGLGLATWGVIGLILWQRERHWAFAIMPDEAVVAARAWLHLGLAGAAVLLWAGVHGVFSTIGNRSRAYRRAHGGRQGIRPMIAATVGIAVGSGLRLLGVYVLDIDAIFMLGTILIWVSMLMTLIGLAYLLINAWWIRQALRHPPPRLDDLLVPLR